MSGRRCQRLLCLLRWPWVIRGQIEQSRGCAQLPYPVIQLTLPLRRISRISRVSPALLLPVMRILHRQIGQDSRQGRRALSVAAGGIQRGYFLHQDTQRPAVGNQMMQAQQQHMLLRRQLQQLGPPQRRLIQRKRLPRHRPRPLLHGLLALLGRQPAQIMSW